MPKVERFIYLDNNATTPLDIEVLKAMTPYFKGIFANPASYHWLGNMARKAVELSREKVGDLIGADQEEIVFTSGATESINLAIKGYATANSVKGKHIITVKTEHKAVLDSCKYLESIGYEVSYLNVSREGLIDISELRKELRPDTILTCVMFVNNEIGLIQPISEITRIVHETNSLFFCDATQAIGKLDVNVNDLGIDLMSFSGHKLYGPKGIGALYTKNSSNDKVKIEAQIHGGGHENGIRSGTLNVPLIVGFGKACEIAKKYLYKNEAKISNLRDELESGLLTIPNAFVNGSIDNRLFNVTNICFPGVDANVMIGRLKSIALSNGSACSSLKIESSHVLKAIGLSEENAMSSIRFSVGKYNSKREINHVIESIKKYTKDGCRLV